MHRLLATVFATLLLASGAFAQSRLQGGMAEELAALPEGATTTAVVVLEGEEPATPEFLNSLKLLGITKARSFRSVPIVGVEATASQIQALASRPGVSAIWPNEQLTYYNYDARHLTGVERLREDASLRTASGLPFSGKGIGVVVNDSGIDAALPDLKYGTRVVQNVLGNTNLKAVDDVLPVTYTEGVINTDLGSGHGTHVAGTVGGMGVSSSGKHAGMAPGADLIGYGSGAVLFILDGIGGFDYAITNQFNYNIRVITNSWGSSGTFRPDHPINLVSYAAYKRGITVLFAAGNSGPGEDTHNPYAVAPWVISVGAGDKFGRLARFSSRGRSGDTRTFTMPDGRTWTSINAPTVVAPGVDIISARATTSALAALEADADVAALGANAAFYSHMSGTSMATPVTAGIAALMLEANPQLQPDDVKRILRRTATNMPGFENWEVGAGYVNAYNAVAMALGRRTDFGKTLNNDGRTFHANALIEDGGQIPFSLYYSPVGERQMYSFEVGPEVALVTARATVSSNTVALVLYDPAGRRYGSSISLPLLGSTVAVSAPGIPGTWKLTISGIGSVSGVALDPLRVTNGYAAPGTVSGVIRFKINRGYTGLSDISGHPAAGAIMAGVSDRLVDARKNGYQPDEQLKRIELAEYLTMGLAIRQSRPLNGSVRFNDVPADLAPFAEAATARAAALKDRFQVAGAVMGHMGTQFFPNGKVTRLDLAYSLVQSLGLQPQAMALNNAFASGTAQMAVRWDDRLIPLSDAGSIPANLKGYVQLALDLGLLNARFSLTQGEYDLTPTLSAAFEPTRTVLRGDFAVATMAAYERYQEGDLTKALGGGNQTTALPDILEAGPEANMDQASTELMAETPALFELKGNAPNPVRDHTEIRFSIPDAMDVQLVVYDMLGREVARPVTGAMTAGAHAVSLDASALSAGTYVYRLETERGVKIGQMVVVR